jgi:hypothetical protein
MIRQVATGREPYASALQRVQLLENGMQLRHLQAGLLFTIGFPGDRRRLVAIVVSFYFREGTWFQHAAVMSDASENSSQGKAGPSQRTLRPTLFCCAAWSTPAVQSLPSPFSYGARKASHSSPIMATPAICSSELQAVW